MDDLNSLIIPTCRPTSYTNEFPDPPKRPLRWPVGPKAAVRSRLDGPLPPRAEVERRCAQWVQATRPLTLEGLRPGVPPERVSKGPAVLLGAGASGERAPLSGRIIDGFARELVQEGPNVQGAFPITFSLLFLSNQEIRIWMCCPDRSPRGIARDPREWKLLASASYMQVCPGTRLLGCTGSAFTEGLSLPCYFN